MKQIIHEFKEQLANNCGFNSFDEMPAQVALSVLNSNLTDLVVLCCQRHAEDIFREQVLAMKAANAPRLLTTYAEESYKKHLVEPLTVKL